MIYDDDSRPWDLTRAAGPEYDAEPLAAVRNRELPDWDGSPWHVPGWGFCRDADLAERKRNEIADQRRRERSRREEWAREHAGGYAVAHGVDRAVRVA